MRQMARPYRRSFGIGIYHRRWTGLGSTIVTCYWWCGDGENIADARLFLVHNINHAYVDCANIHRARDLFEQTLDQLISSNTFASGNDEIEWDSDGDDMEETLHDYADVCGRNRSSSGNQEAQAQENQVKNDNSMNAFQQDKETRMKPNMNNTIDGAYWGGYFE